MSFISDLLLDEAICSDEELLLATLCGDHIRGEENGVEVTFSQYKGKTYVLDSKIGVRVV